MLEHTFRRGFKATAEAFYNDMGNLIELARATPPNPFVNSGHKAGRGLEFEIEARRASGWAARASYSLAEATDPSLNQRLTNSPLHLAKLNATIPVSRRADAGMEVLYTSPQKSDVGAYVPSSLLTNISVSSKPLWGGYEFSASCYDLFNRQWFAPGGPEHVQSTIPQDGRTYRFKATYRFSLPKGKTQW